MITHAPTEALLDEFQKSAGPRSGAGTDVVELRLLVPVLSVGMLRHLGQCLERARQAGAPVVISSAHASIFAAGADLAEIAALNVESSGAYAERGRRLMAAISSHPAPVVAAVAGACAGGGVDLALSCDRIIAGPGAWLAHPGVRRGLVTGWGGTAMLPVRLDRSACTRMLLEGSRLDAASLLEAGLAAAVIDDPADDPVEAAAREAGRLASMNRSRLSLWRTLRDGRFVDRFRAVVVHKQGRETGFSFAIRRS